MEKWKRRRRRQISVVRGHSLLLGQRWGAVKRRVGGRRRSERDPRRGRNKEGDGGQDTKGGGPPPPPTAPVPLPPPRRVSGALKTPLALRRLLDAASPIAPNPSIAASSAAIRPRRGIPRRACSPKRGAMVNTPAGSLIDAPSVSTTASGNGDRSVINTPHSRSRQLSSFPTARRSSRNTTNPYRGHPPPMRLGSEASGPYEKKRKAPEKEAPCGISKAADISDSAPLTPRDPNRTYSSKDGAKGRLTEQAMVGNAWSSQKRRKCMRTGNYLSLFKSSSKGEAAAVAVRSEQSSIPTKTNKVKESPFQKLQRLPDGCHPDFDNDHLCSVNKLREFWHKSQGAVFVDDKEHIMKTILFILSVLHDACKPFLLLTTASLPLWEAEFSRFAPCINVVVYDGDKDVHKLVQNLELHENGRHTMLYVLLAHPDAILENIKNIECIGWEAVIVDYCQSSVMNHLKQLKQLPTDFRMVLLSSPLKDNLLEYKNLLAFLNSEQEDNGDYVDADALAMLRARFTRHIAYERKVNSSKFLEYWVPAYLSQAQLKLYYSMLLANSSILQSQTTTNSIGALRDIVMCLWKCCNHPCLVGLQHSLVNTRDVPESTDDSVRESGKLLLLEKMLKEIRNKRLRAIVLFQSDGAVGDGMGNILEELILHRFGPESYERVQNRSAFSTKQEAMNKFNDTRKGRFVFLIDSRACHSSINLSSVDTIIIYGSDLNPLNDLKALRKIKIESQLKYVRVFRLYAPFTVEEKGLVLSKQSMIVDSNDQDILYSTIHCLLSWGASFLFSKVDELQQDNCASKVMMDKVISEFLTELSMDIEDGSKMNSAIISKACMSGEFYSRNITLVGEREGVSSLDGDPPIFWLNLLEKKSCCQRYKRTEVPTEETNEARRKLSKTGEIAGSSCTDLHLLPDTGVENLSTPKSLHAELKHGLSKLIQVLKLPDDVCFQAKQFLEYLLKNHLVVREPQGLLHAFNIALCWCAASVLNYGMLDHRESLALATECLNYECSEELSVFFYEKLGILKEKFGHKQSQSRNKIQNDSSSPHGSSSTNLRSDHIFPKQARDLHANLTNGTQESPSAPEQMVSDGQELVSAPEADRELHLSSEDPPGRPAAKRIDLFNVAFSLREKNITEKQQLEISNLRKQRDSQVMKLQKVCHAVVQHIRISDIDEEIRNDQIELVIQWFTMLRHAFLVHMRLQLAKLDALQSKTWVEEKLMKEKLKQVVLSGQLDQFLDLCDTLPDSDFVVEEFIHFKKQNGLNHVDNILALGCDQLLDDRLMEITLVRSSVPSEAFSIPAVRNEPTEDHMSSGVGAASESVDLPDDNVHCGSDGIDLQRACSASTIPASHDSNDQESSTGEARSTEHARREIIANASMLPGSATSIVMGINADNDDGTVAADPDHLESPILVSPQNLMTLQHPPAEAEPTDALLAMDAQDMQTSCPTLDAQSRRTRPDDSREMNLAAGMFQEGTTSDCLGDSSTIVKDKNVDAVAADPLSLENHSYTAPHNLAVLPDALEVETHTDQSSMPAQHSTSVPARQKFAISGHPPAEAESSGNLDKEAAYSLQPDIQSSCSILDADSSQTTRQLETTHHHLVDGRMGFDVVNNGTVSAHRICSESSISAAPQIPAMFPFSSEVGTPANLSNTSSLQSSDAPSRHPPAVAESPGMLDTQDTQVEQDLHPDMRPSTSLLGVPLGRMFLDEASQTSCQPDGATDLSEEGETEHLTRATCNLATLPLSREAETENSEASMPAQEIRSPHAQHSLATSHLLVDLQPPTSILSEEAGRADMLCAATDRDLQHGMQPSITTQDVRLERIDLSGMLVTQSTAVQERENLEPSRGHAEQADTLGMLSAPDSRLEVQPPSLMQDQPAEREGAGTSVAIVAQNLQPETQSSTSVFQPERTHPDEMVQIDLQPNMALGPEQLTQLFTEASAASHNLSSSSEPMRNELERLKYVKGVLSNEYEKKKSLLQTLRNQEVEKIMNKYELLLQQENYKHHQWTTGLNDFYRKLFMQQSLAENFRERFMKSTPAQERSASPGIRQAPQPFPQAQATQTTSSLPVASPLATRPPGLASLYSAGPCVQPSQVVRASASGAIEQQSVLPGNLYRAAPSPVGSMPLRNGSFIPAGTQGRASVPLLQQLQMPALSAMPGGDQQQLGNINPGITSSRQYAPGLLGKFASSSALQLAGVPLSSVATSSVQQEMPSAANSLPSLPASLLLRGSSPELMANFVQSPRTIPVAMAAQQASSLIPGLHHVPGGPLNGGAAGVWHAGGHVAGTSQAAPELSREALMLFRRQWPHAVPHQSSVQQTVASVSNIHPGLAAASASRYLMASQQALSQNPAAFGNVMAGPQNAAGGVWHGGALPAVANQPSPGLASWSAGRIGGQTSGPASTRAGQGGARQEEVCLSDDDS